MLDRRHCLALMAAAGLAACGTGPDRFTFVLVHGTWHGAWVWTEVKASLEAAGHRVFTPVLTGVGERIAESAPEIGLEDHIQDIVRTIRDNDLREVVLIGHSFSGIAITGAADRLRDRILHLCFFDALVPTETRRSGVPREPDGSLPDWFVVRQAAFEDGYKMDLWADYPIDMLLPPDHPKADWVRERITTHPAKSWTDELVLENGGWSGLDRSYIHAAGQTYRRSSDAMIGPARGPGWTFLELDVPRDGMVTHPEHLSQTFVMLAAAAKTRQD